MFPKRADTSPLLAEFVFESLMDFAFTEEEQAFRGKVRQFLRDNMPEQLRRNLAEGRVCPKTRKLS